MEKFTDAPAASRSSKVDAASAAVRCARGPPQRPNQQIQNSVQHQRPGLLVSAKRGKALARPATEIRRAQRSKQPAVAEHGAWVRFSRSDCSGVENLGGRLTTIVGRVCLDMLQSRRSRRE
jgi:hypothetical protein